MGGGGGGVLLSFLCCSIAGFSSFSMCHILINVSPYCTLN